MEELTTENTSKTYITKKRNSPSKDQIILGVHSEKPKILSEEEIKKKEHNRKKTEKQKIKKKEKWYKPKIDSNIYISNLPEDINVKKIKLNPKIPKPIKTNKQIFQLINQPIK